MTDVAGLEGYRLSPQQRRLWRLREESGSEVFRSRCLLRISGYSAATLDAALARVVAAHEVLRGTYEKLPEMALPVQVPRPAARFRVEDAGTADAEELWARPAASEGILTAVRAEAGNGGHLLLLELPALSADARTWTALAAEIARALEAGDAYEPEALPYAQFAQWQNGLLEDEDAAEGRAWWEARKLSAIEPLRWPFAVGEGALRPARIEFNAPAETAASLFATVERLGVSPEVFALAAWQVLLARFTGRRELISGWLDAGRGHESLEGALGLFARVLPIPSHLQPGLPFAEVVRQTASWIEESSEHAEHFRPGSPFAAGFAWEDRTGVERLEAVTERFDLLLTGIRDGDALAFAAVPDESRVSLADAGRVVRLFATLLTHASRAPETPWDDLDLLTPAEHRELLAAGDGGTLPFPEDATLHGLFAAQAARTPDRIAVEAGGESLTYAELAARARRLARHLRGLGVGPDVPVGILLERSVDWMAAVWGVLEAGGACLPLDPSHPAERLAGILQEARVPAVVTREALVEEAADGIAWVFLDRHAGEIAGHAGSPLESATLPGNLAYVISTSGTSGRPKGVMVTHRSAVHLAAALEHAVYRHHDRTEGLRVSVNAPLTFDASVKQWLQLLAGRTLVIAPEEARPDADRLAAWVREARVDVLDCTPSQLRGLLDAGMAKPGDLAPAAVLAGGEAIDPGLWTRLAALDVSSYNVYGPTECTVDVTVHPVAGAPRPVLGKPLPNVRAHVLDVALRPVPCWVAGELLVGGAGVARGYLARPGLTAERFVPDPFSSRPGERLYRTGDRVRRLPLPEDGGDLEFLGRLDHQVKVRGFRIELEEIEAVLAAHPDVRRAAAAVRDTPAGPQLAAWAALRTGATPGEDFRAWLRRRLPEFMVPAVVAVLPDLPLTRHGKVDRAALPDPGEALSSRPIYVEPRSEAERTVAAVWADVLGVASVGVADNFFDLGGHSLLMVRAHGRLQEAFGRPISMVDLFRYPTVEALAGHLTRSPGEPAPEAVTLDTVRDRAERQREEQERQRQAMQRARRLR